MTGHHHRLPKRGGEWRRDPYREGMHHRDGNARDQVVAWLPACSVSTTSLTRGGDKVRCPLLSFPPRSITNGARGMTRTAPDPSSRDDDLLMRDVIEVDNSLGRYVVRFVDADTGCADHLSVADERALAERLTALADGIRARAGRREREATVHIDATNLRANLAVPPSSVRVEALDQRPLCSDLKPKDARATAVESAAESLVALEQPVRRKDVP